MGGYAYYEYLKTWCEDFGIEKALNGSYPHGTPIGRRYYNADDQGHVAMLLDNGRVLQSYEDAALGQGKPGVNWDVKIYNSHYSLPGDLYQWAWLPKNWINYPRWDEF